MRTDLASEIAATYLSSQPRPVSPAEVAQLQEWVDGQYARMSASVAISFQSDYQPTYEQVMAQLKDGVLVVSTDSNEDTLWGPSTNLRFRAIHDWHHFQGGGDFSFLGEARTWAHCSRGLSPELREILFSEIVGQASVAITTGQFPAQYGLRWPSGLMEEVEGLFL